MGAVLIEKNVLRAALPSFHFLPCFKSGAPRAPLVNIFGLERHMFGMERHWEPFLERNLWSVILKKSRSRYFTPWLHFFISTKNRSQASSYFPVSKAALRDRHSFYEANAAAVFSSEIRAREQNSAHID